jgi:hypothetical protein
MSAVCPPSNDPVEPKPARDGRRRNNLQHGLRAVTLGGMPRGASYVGRLVLQLRTSLEQAVTEAKGEVSLTDACGINTACRWERHAMLATRWLRQGFETMTLDQRLNFSREVAKASAARDAAIRELRLSTDPQTIVQGLYGPVTPLDGQAGNDE